MDHLVSLNASQTFCFFSFHNQTPTFSPDVILFFLRLILEKILDLDGNINKFISDV